MKQFNKTNMSRWFTLLSLAMGVAGLVPSSAFAESKRPVKLGQMEWCDTCHAFVQKPIKGDVAVYEKKLPSDQKQEGETTAVEGNQ